MKTGWSRRPEWSHDPREDANEDPPEWVQVTTDADGDPVLTIELPEGEEPPFEAQASSPGSHCNSRIYWIWLGILILVAMCGIGAWLLDQIARIS